MPRAPEPVPALAGALAVLLLGSSACSDDPHRPPPPPRFDAGPGLDAGPDLDAAPWPDAGPSADGGPGSSTMHRDYGTDFDVCPPVQIPLWGDLRWTATIPEGASISFSAQAAPAGDGLSGAERVTLGTAPPATPPLYVADALSPDHQNDPQLRITALLRWSSADAQPTLDQMSLDWVCLDRP